MPSFRFFFAVGFFSTLCFGCDTFGDSPGPPPLIRFGAIADVQYCNCDYNETLHRDYRASIPKLHAAVLRLNAAYDRGEIAFSIHLGDLVDRDIADFAPVLSVWRKLSHEAFLVPGNHELGAARGNYDLAVKSLGIESTTGRGYYSFKVQRAPGWRFLVLDGNDASLAGSSGTPERIRGDSLYSLALLRDPRSVDWNGGLSDKQLVWFKAELDASVAADEHVLVFSHFPLGGTPGLNLWNAEDVLDILRSYENVLGFFGGHFHQPYTVSNVSPPQIGVPSLLGDTDAGEYGIASIYPTYIEWEGQHQRLFAWENPLFTLPILLGGTGLPWLVFFAFAYFQRTRPATRDAPSHPAPAP